MHDALKEKLKWKLGERLEEEGEEDAVEVVEDELDNVFDGKKKRERTPVDGVLEELVNDMQEEPPEIARRIEDNIWDLF